MDPLTPIPTPAAQRWREFRIQVMPVLTFLFVTACIVLMWGRYIIPTNVVGEVEAVRINLISAVPGTLKELGSNVVRFGQVTNGQPIAVVVTMDPQTQQAELHAIEADLRVMQARMELDVMRNLQNYESMRLSLLKERVDLAYLKTQHLYYQNEAKRLEQLLKQQIGTVSSLVSTSAYEDALRLAESARVGIEEGEKYVGEKEKVLPKLEPTTTANSPILEAIKAQEEKFRLTQDNIVLKAPMDGIIIGISNYPGSKLVANTPILTISANKATRIVGYVRKPFSSVPQPGDVVQVRRQSFKREIGTATVTDVTRQLEPISPTLVPPVTGVKVELGLPFAVSLPAELNLFPGEAVDIIITRK